MKKGTIQYILAVVYVHTLTLRHVTCTSVPVKMAARSRQGCQKPEVDKDETTHSQT